MSDELIASHGPLPRTHGLLGAMLVPDAEAQRATDIREDPRFRGRWPDTHPSMSSFLGVPIVARGNVAGAFYLTDKPGGFSDDDRSPIETFAAHAALAIENARLHERSRERRRRASSTPRTPAAGASSRSARRSCARSRPSRCPSATSRQTRAGRATSSRQAPACASSTAC